MPRFKTELLNFFIMFVEFLTKTHFCQKFVKRWLSKYFLSKFQSQIHYFGSSFSGPKHFKPKRNTGNLITTEVKSYVEPKPKGLLKLNT